MKSVDHSVREPLERHVTAIQVRYAGRRTGPPVPGVSPETGGLLSQFSLRAAKESSLVCPFVPIAPTRVSTTCEPVYKALPGWEETLDEVAEVSELPSGARAYIEFVEEQLGV